MDAQDVRRMVLDYAVWNKCWKTFNELYTDEAKEEIPRVVLALFAIRKVLEEDAVDRFGVAIDILNRIYTQHLGCSYGVYWRIIMALKIKVFVKSVKTESPEVYRGKLQDLLTGLHILLHGEKESELDKARQKIWKFYLKVLPLISSTNSKKDICDRYGPLLSEKTLRDLEMFSTSVLQNQPPCDLELILRQHYDDREVVTKNPVEGALYDLVKDKSVLSDEDLLSILETINQTDVETGNSVGDLKNDEMSEVFISQDSNKCGEISEASALWNKECGEDMALSVIAPSVSEEDYIILLSDFEDDVAFKDKETSRAPDLASFLKSFQNEERL